MSTSQPNVKRLKSRRSENVFDDLKSFSQPVVVTNVFGKSDKRITTTIQRLSNQDSSLKKQQSSSVNLKSNSSQSFVKGNNQLLDGTLFVIVLPMILKKDFSPYMQPIMLKIYGDNLSEFGFSIPFDQFFNETENYFTVKVNTFEMTVQLLATGDSLPSLKECLSKNININKNWKCLKKIVPLTEQISKLFHSPLENQDDIPPQQVLSEKSFDKIFVNEKEKIAKRTSPSTSHFEDSQSHENNQDLDDIFLEKTQVSNESAIDDSKKKSQDYSGKLNNKYSESDISDSADLSTSEINAKKFNQLIDELERKKLLLSEHDTTGSTFIVMIEAFKTLNTILTEKNQKENDSVNSVPEVDQTYKVSQKNQIFIEGLIQFDLDRYQAALKKSRAENPCAIAYQIINICFPESYFRDVTLGKRIISRDEIDELLKKKKNDSKIKYPLIYIWGFKDPFSMRMTGKFDFHLGQKRVTAFIHHIFRKSNILRFSDSLESRVRERIVKTLCAKNADSMNQIQKDDETNFSDEIDSDEYENGVDSLFDQDTQE